LKESVSAEWSNLYASLESRVKNFGTTVSKNSIQAIILLIILLLTHGDLSSLTTGMFVGYLTIAS